MIEKCNIKLSQEDNPASLIKKLKDNALAIDIKINPILNLILLGSIIDQDITTVSILVKDSRIKKTNRAALIASDIGNPDIIKILYESGYKFNVDHLCACCKLDYTNSALYLISKGIYSNSDCLIAACINKNTKLLSGIVDNIQDEINYCDVLRCCFDDINFFKFACGRFKFYGHYTCKDEIFCLFTYLIDNGLKSELTILVNSKVFEISGLIFTYAIKVHTDQASIIIFSPMQSPRQSPRQSPMQSPRQSPRQSPMQSPMQSPRQSPMQSPRQSPIRSPIRSPIHSPIQSPIRSPRHSPKHSPIRSPISLSKMKHNKSLLPSINESLKQSQASTRPFFVTNTQETTKAKKFGEIVEILMLCDITEDIIHDCMIKSHSYHVLHMINNKLVSPDNGNLMRLAIKLNMPDILEALIINGGDVRCADDELLYLACLDCRIECIKILLKYGKYSGLCSRLVAISKLCYECLNKDLILLLAEDLFFDIPCYTLYIAACLKGKTSLALGLTKYIKLVQIGIGIRCTIKENNYYTAVDIIRYTNGMSLNKLTRDLIAKTNDSVLIEEINKYK